MHAKPGAKPDARGQSGRPKEGAVFAFARHGYRNPFSAVPRTALSLGPGVKPETVRVPTYGLAYASELLDGTVRALLPSIVRRVERLSARKGASGHGSPARSDRPGGRFESVRTRGTAAVVVPDASVQRCWTTAAGWTRALRSPRACRVCAAPTAVTQAVDPAVNTTAAEAVAIAPAVLLAAEIEAARANFAVARRQWRRLLRTMGFRLVGSPPGLTGTAASSGERPTDLLEMPSKERVLRLLGLPPTAFDFATCVIMSVGLPGFTARQLLVEQARWPAPRTDDAREWYRRASEFLATLLLVQYPPGVAADAIASAPARLASGALGSRPGLEGSRFLVAVAHEEGLAVLLRALGLGSRTYPRPTETHLYVRRAGGHGKGPDSETVDVWRIRNPVSRDGRAVPVADARRAGTISLAALKRLAASAPPAPRRACVPTSFQPGLCAPGSTA